MPIEHLTVKFISRLSLLQTPGVATAIAETEDALRFSEVPLFVRRDYPFCGLRALFSTGIIAK